MIEVMKSRFEEIENNGIDSVIETLSEYKDKYQKYGYISVEAEEYYEYGDSYARIVVYYSSPETEEEKQERISVEKAQNAFCEQRERAEYERLKEKYGE